MVSDPTSLVPADALVFKGVQALSNWQEIVDTAVANSTACGQTTIVASPSLSGAARQFVTRFTSYGNKRYWVVFGDNTAVTNFLYDGWVYVARPSSTIGNVEFDMNQVMSKGQTVIYGFQCDGYSGTWDYMANEGTPEAPSDQWLHLAFPCNPRNWSTNARHQVQITYSRDAYGTVTYQSVWFDGVEEDLNATVYLDNLTVYSW